MTPTVIRVHMFDSTVEPDSEISALKEFVAQYNRHGFDGVPFEVFGSIADRTSTLRISNYRWFTIDIANAMPYARISEIHNACDVNGNSNHLVAQIAGVRPIIEKFLQPDKAHFTARYLVESGSTPRKVAKVTAIDLIIQDEDLYAEYMSKRYGGAL